jgi:hypothetical protein
MKKKSRATRKKHSPESERARMERARYHSVSIWSPSVIEFGDPSLREAFRIWWHPYDMGADFDALTGRDGVVIRTKPTKRGGRGTIKRIPAAHPVMGGDQIERRKLDPGYYRRIERVLGKRRKRDLPSRRKAPVNVVITLNYPLAKPCSKIVTIDRRYPGEIFALTHDFYRELYAEDEKGGGKAGPSGGKGPMLNRGFGPLVWGHDLGDLVFESCEYRAFDKKMVKYPLNTEGEFTFGIGS